VRTSKYLKKLILVLALVSTTFKKMDVVDQLVPHWWDLFLIRLTLLIFLCVFYIFCPIPLPKSTFPLLSWYCAFSCKTRRTP